MTKVLSSSGHSKGTRGDISLILAMLFTAVTIAVVITQQLIASQRIKLLYQISEAIDGYAFNEINTWRLFYRNKAALPLDTGLLKGTITTTTNGVASSISYLSTGKSEPAPSAGGAAGVGASFCAGSRNSKLCIGNKPSANPPVGDPTGQWAWMAGDKVNFGMVGNYGTQGVAAASNVPPGRTLAAGWKDATNNLWLFGGFGILSGTPGFFNDLWKFDGTQWTWIAGHNQLNQRGVRGTQGVAAAANTPGARQGATSWRDINNNFWLYGGYGKDPNGNLGYFNDLWKFDGAHWTFVSGYITNSMQYYGPNGEIYEGAPGFYGVKGVGASTNAPSARYGATAWADNSKNTWLFGGLGVDANGQIGKLNDLWKFDGSTWVWLSGANTRDQVGSYGAKGSAISTNTPGARVGHVSWMDATNNFWIFGGYTDNLGGIKKMNDLWKFDGANWIWVSGSSTENAIPVYGTQGVGAPANTPGARSDAIAWTDSSNVLWLFSGEGRNSLGQFGALYDMWNFDGTNWIWVLGTDAIFPYSGWSDDLKGIYGTLGRPDPANKASARDHAVAWADTTKHLWLFGGRGFDSNGNIGFQNDLWKFKY